MLGGSRIVNYFISSFIWAKFATTLIFTSRVNGSPVQVVVDNASKHSFIQARMVKFLESDTEPTPTFWVVSGIWQRLRCEGVARKFPITIQGNKIVDDLPILSIHGTDIVVMVSRLVGLGRFLTDYAKRIFEFSLNWSMILLKGDVTNDHQPVQLPSLSSTIWIWFGTFMYPPPS